MMFGSVPGGRRGETARQERPAGETEAVPAGTTGTVPGPTATGAWYRRDGFGPRGRRIATYLLLVGVMGAVAAMSFSGLFAYGTSRLHWSHGHSLLVPVSLDAAALVSYAFALDRIEKGETGAQFRLIALSLVAMSAFVNWDGALSSGNFSEEVIFPFMSVMAYWLIHSVMSAIRRDIRMEQHGQKAKERPEPLPDFGWLAWVPGIGAPLKAVSVIRTDIRARIRVIEARVSARVDRRLAELETGSRETGGGSQVETEVPPPVVQSHVSLSIEAVPSQSDAIRLAIDSLERLQPGREITARDVVEYLASHDRPGVKPQRVSTLAARDDKYRLRLVTSRPETSAGPAGTTETAGVPAGETSEEETA